MYAYFFRDGGRTTQAKCCNEANGHANRIEIAQPRPIAPPRIDDRGEIEVHEPLE